MQSVRALVQRAHAEPQETLKLALALGGAALLARVVAKLYRDAVTRRRHHRLRASRSEAAAETAAATAPPASDAEYAAAHACVSARLQHALANDDTPLQNLNHFIRIADPERYPEYHPRHHPDGYISAAIAENKTTSHLLPYLQHRPGLGMREQGYANFNGMPHVRRAVADFLGHYVAGREVDPESILMTAGCNMAIDSLFFSIANPGEYCLLATPYYAAFKWDLGLKSGVLIHPVPGDAATGFAFDLAAYKRALAEARAMGRVVRAVLLCNPHNPTGTVLTREELQQLADWVRSEPGLHLVSDEIYALSIYGHRLPSDEQVEAEAQQPAVLRAAKRAWGGLRDALLLPSGSDQPAAASPFVSLLSVLDSSSMRSDGARFHVLYAFSKDFGLSGFRCGMVVTENRAVRRGYDQLSQFNGLSTDVAHYFYLLLSDRSALARYVDGMQAGLAAAAAEMGRELRGAGVPFVRGAGGVFLWLDLTAHLDEPTAAAETRLYKAILAECNVNLTPGTAFHSPQPGWFRFIFTASPVATMQVAVRRIAALLADQPRLQRALEKARDA